MSSLINILEGFVAKDEVKIKALDVGCSGYVSFHWERLIENLVYFGIDPLVKEIQRLQKLHPEFHYLDGFVSAEGCKRAADAGTVRFFNRSSAYSDMQSGFELIKTNFNHGQEVVYSEKSYSPDQLALAFGVSSFDMIKIDVDGDDYAILRGFLTNPTFAENLLAFEIESQFHGDAGEHGNTFDNIMRLAREHRFHLYKLDSYTYSRAAKPKPYVFDFPAQTYGGQVLWGDSVFIRDALEENNRERVMKLIKIYQVYDLDDCAFEALEYHRELLGMEMKNFVSSFQAKPMQVTPKLKVLLRKIKRKIIAKLT